MSTYQNLGPPWRRGGGEVVPRGAEFEATKREHQRFQRRRSQLFLLVETSPQVDGSTDPTEWPLKMQPELYLRLHTGGKHAALARRLLKAGA